MHTLLKEMADETFQNVLEVYKQKKVIISKAHSIGQFRLGEIEKALCGIHVVGEDRCYSKCLEHLENIPDLPDIDVTEARKIFLHQFVETSRSNLYLCHLGHNLYVNALVDKNQEVLQKLHSDYHVDFSLFENPLHLAVECRLLPMMGFLVNEKGMDVNCVDIKGNTPLHHLMKYRQQVILIFSFNSSMSDNARYDNSSRTEVLQFLKNKGARLSVRNQQGRTPLQYAIVDQHITDINEFIDTYSDFSDFNPETRIEILELVAAKQIFSDNEEDSIGGVKTYKLALGERRKHNIPNTRKKPPQEHFFEDIVEPDTENSEFLNLICAAGEKRKRLILGLLIYERILGCRHFCFLKESYRYLLHLKSGLFDGSVSTHHILQSLTYYFNFLKNEKVFKEREKRPRDCFDHFGQEPFSVEEVADLLTFFDFERINYLFTKEELLDLLLYVYVCVFQIKIDQDEIPSEKDRVHLFHFLDIILSRPLTEKNEFTLRKALKTLISAGNASKRGQVGLIHSIVDPMLTLRGEYYVYVFNHGPEILERLLDCGASIHELDEQNMNILQCFFTNSIENFNQESYELFSADEVENFNKQLREIVNIAVERGIHVDQGFKIRELGQTVFKTVLDQAVGTEFYPIVNNPKYRSLKCLAASVIIKKDISYRNEVPTELIHWIDFHMGKREFYN
ncbi:protein fem-1 homolog C-like [Saccostrea echinata]|uniref:protein fem-1 homolog C-like n=1 Tax=Saccostrea echinata TaxID=191078 RepID=UPI002A83EECF|nr:protein fem-1 homolog C-like [Saccostrea echinata]